MTTLKELRRAYGKACAMHLYEFILDDRIIVTNYARYLIQYLEAQAFPANKTIDFTPVQPICPDCKAPLQDLLFLGVQHEGYVCPVCKVWFSDEMKKLATVIG